MLFLFFFWSETGVVVVFVSRTLAPSMARPLVDWSKVHEDGKMKTIAHTDQAGLDRGLNRETRRAARKLHFQVECLCLTLAAIWFLKCSYSVLLLQMLLLTLMLVQFYLRSFQWSCSFVQIRQWEKEGNNWHLLRQKQRQQQQLYGSAIWLFVQFHIISSCHYWHRPSAAASWLVRQS